MFSNCAGNIGRFAGPVLTSLQSADEPTLTAAMEQSLHILLAIVKQAQPRDVCVSVDHPTPCCACTQMPPSKMVSFVLVGSACLRRSNPSEAHALFLRQSSLLGTRAANKSAQVKL